MNKTQDNKKCFCARCFLPIDFENRVNIDGQNFHKICSMCCICRMIPTSLKMFYGHVFCNECFKIHVISKFKGDNTRLNANSWWMQWGPGVQSQDKTKEGVESSELPSKEPKRLICARCLQPVDKTETVTIADQTFHTQCGQCYFCHKVPSSNPKIYYGQMFCEECFHRHVLDRNKDNPTEFFNNCFEQWQSNAHFAENMRQFMGGNRESTPFIFMMQGQQPPFCRCGTGPQHLFQTNETGTNEATKSAIPTLISFGDNSLSWDLPYENLPDPPETFIPESNVESAKEQNFNVTAAEKIEKLTKYLQEDVIMKNFDKKWKFLEKDPSIDESFCGWIDLDDKTNSRNCPKCLWQCGPIYVNSQYII